MDNGDLTKLYSLVMSQPCYVVMLSKFPLNVHMMLKSSKDVFLKRYPYLASDR
jgi:hypothetical protein